MFLVAAQEIRIDGENPGSPFIHINTRTCTDSHAHASTRADESIHTNVWSKLRPDTDDKQQLKGHNYTVIHIHQSAAEIIEIAVPR